MVKRKSYKDEAKYLKRKLEEKEQELKEIKDEFNSKVNNKLKLKPSDDDEEVEVIDEIEVEDD